MKWLKLRYYSWVNGYYLKRNDVLKAMKYYNKYMRLKYGLESR